MDAVVIITIGERIMVYRRRARLTKTKLAEMIGVPVHTITEFEDNKKVPDEEQTERIAKALGCSVDQMLYGI